MIYKFPTGIFIFCIFMFADFLLCVTLFYGWIVQNNLQYFHCSYLLLLLLVVLPLSVVSQWFSWVIWNHVYSSVFIHVEFEISTNRKMFVDFAQKKKYIKLKQSYSFILSQNEFFIPYLPTLPFKSKFVILEKFYSWCTIIKDFISRPSKYWGK